MSAADEADTGHDINLQSFIQARSTSENNVEFAISEDHDQELNAAGIQEESKDSHKIYS